MNLNKILLSFLVNLWFASVNANAGELNSTTQKVVNHYQNECGNNSFKVGENAITTITSSMHDIDVTVVSTANMRCGDSSMGYCGSSGCSSHIVAAERVYDTNGGVPFLLSNDPFVIAWWTSGYRCDVEGDRTIANATSCMLVAVWDDHAKRLRYPHGKNHPDSWLNDK